MRGFVKRVMKMLPKLPDEQVKRVLNSVSAEYNMLSAVIESIPTGVVIVNKSWYILQSNKAADRLLFSGEIEEGSIEKEPIWFFVAEPDIAQFIKKTAEADKTNISNEFTINFYDGSVHFLVVSILSYVDEGELLGNIIKIEDVTQQRTKDVLARRMENMAGLTNLAAGIAHEIKNPLGAISIHIQLVQKAIEKKRKSDGMLPDKKLLEDHIDIVNEEIENLNNLVMDFLFAVRPVKATLVLSNIDKLLKNIVDFFSPEFNKNGISISLNLPNQDVKLLIDEKLFRELIINLAQNSLAAIKSKFENQVSSEFNDNSKIKGRLDFAAELKGDRYVLKITDNGCGMSKETVSRIFEPYFTTKANGTGLGMTMVYKIIKEFNGDIHVKSELGEGTVFSISIPIPQTDKKLLENKTK